MSDKADKKKLGRPALTPETREKQLSALAMDLAEQKLRDGTASSQVITHFLKLASPTEKLDIEIKEKQKELLVAKADALKTNERLESLYTEALEAFATYSGKNTNSSENYDEYEDYED